MAKKWHNEVAVGVTVLAVLALAFYIVVALGDWSRLFSRQKHIMVRLDYQTGLKGLGMGSPILLGGAKVGAITEAGLVPESVSRGEPQPFVFFRMELPAGLPLRQDCLLASESNLLGAQASLVIKTLGREGPVLNDGQTATLRLQGGIAEALDNLRQELDANRPGSLLYRIKYELSRDQADSLLASLAASLENIRQITASLNNQLTDDPEKQTLLAKLRETAGHLESVTAELQRQLTQPGAAGTDDRTVLVKVHAALDNLNNALASIDDLVRTNKEPVTQTVESIRKAAGVLEADMPKFSQQVQQVLASADQAMTTGQAALGRLNASLGDFHTMIRTNRDSINRVVLNLEELSVNLKMTSRDVRRAPWKLLYQPSKSEQELQAVVDAAGAFAAGAERLDDAATRIKAVLEAAREGQPVDAEQMQNLVGELQTSFDRFGEVQQKLWEQLR